MTLPAATSADLTAAWVARSVASITAGMAEAKALFDRTPFPPALGRTVATPPVLTTPEAAAAEVARWTAAVAAGRTIYVSARAGIAHANRGFYDAGNIGRRIFLGAKVARKGAFRTLNRARASLARAERNLAAANAALAALTAPVALLLAA